MNITHQILLIWLSVSLILSIGYAGAFAAGYKYTREGVSSAVSSLLSAFITMVTILVILGIL